MVEGFGSITRDNQLIITMEWVAEGLTLCFIGVLYVTFRADPSNPVSVIVYQAAALMLLVMAVWAGRGFGFLSKVNVREIILSEWR